MNPNRVSSPECGLFLSFRAICFYLVVSLSMLEGLRLSTMVFEKAKGFCWKLRIREGSELLKLCMMPIMMGKTNVLRSIGCHGYTTILIMDVLMSLSGSSLALELI